MRFILILLGFRLELLILKEFDFGFFLGFFSIVMLSFWESYVFDEFRE